MRRKRMREYFCIYIVLFTSFYPLFAVFYYIKIASIFIRCAAPVWSILCWMIGVYCLVYSDELTRQMHYNYINFIAKRFRSDSKSIWIIWQYKLRLFTQSNWVDAVSIDILPIP